MHWTPDPRHAALTGDADWTASVPVEQIPAVIGQLAALQLGLAARLLQGQDHADQLDRGDTLLRVGDAAKRLGMTKDYLYRHADQLPFTVRPGRRQLRFSSQGIDRYIKQRQGR